MVQENIFTPIDLPLKETTINILHMEFLWNSFEIPWDRIPANMRTMCEKGEKDKNVINEIVRIIINEMRQIKENIPRHALKHVANMMCQKYPQMFQDFDDDGTVIAGGSCTIFSKFMERSTYLNRPHKRPHFSVSVLPPAIIKKRKILWQVVLNGNQIVQFLKKK